MYLYLTIQAFIQAQHLKTNLFKDLLSNNFRDPVCCVHMETDLCLCADYGVRWASKKRNIMLLKKNRLNYLFKMSKVTCRFKIHTLLNRGTFFGLMKLNSGHLYWRADHQDHCFCCKTPSDDLEDNRGWNPLLRRLREHFNHTSDLKLKIFFEVHCTSGWEQNNSWRKPKSSTHWGWV